MSDDGVLCNTEHAFDYSEMMNLFEDSQTSPDEVLLTEPSPVPSWIGDIENMLMNDDDSVIDEDVMLRTYFDDFLSDVLLDVAGDANLSPSDQKSCPQSDVSDSTGKDNATANLDAKGEDDDPNSKKRKRQLRNKDAALRSRERKKMYVKDLEIKSTYLEGECRRLGHLLQCFYAENQDLRFRLHMGNGAAGATMTKQESAVLLLESLLLGSLFWFLGTMCLFHLPKLLCSNKEAVVLQGIVKNDPRNVHQSKAKSNDIQSLKFGSLFNIRRCRALRTKMKPLCSSISPLHPLCSSMTEEMVVRIICSFVFVDFLSLNLNL